MRMAGRDDTFANGVSPLQENEDYVRLASHVYLNGIRM
jgi:hypothetical protein